MKRSRTVNNDPFKGRKKVIPIRALQDDMSFETKVEKFGQYLHDPDSHGKIFTELGFTYVDDGCDGGCEECDRQNDCTVYEAVKECEEHEARKKRAKVLPLKKK